MAPLRPDKLDKTSIDVVEIDSSDDDDYKEIEKCSNDSGARRNFVSTNAGQLPIKPEEAGGTEISPSTEYRYRPLDSRSFWKAGGFEIGHVKSTSLQGELEHARVHPKFLHSNATSHKWAFGAIAELLDNAVDEICNGATFVKIDRICNIRDNSPALLFQDDGGGMDPEGIRKCMSLGYSSKTSKKTIGQYGNGFKTSTMRLGADVIVFSRATRSGRATQSVGLLSYTFLCRTGQDDVIVPMIDFDISGHWAEPIVYSSQDDWSSNLKAILEWSPFASKIDLMQQFEDIGAHGTKVIIYNLWLNDEGIYELNFDDDNEDIRLRDETNRGGLAKANKRTRELQSHISYRFRYSLRAYASILYLRKFKNFKIILRGKPIEQFNIVDDLKYTEVISYRPNLAAASEEASTKTTLGFIKEAPALGVCGFNIYHKNRLIRPFWKVTADGSSKGNGVVGVLEANFIEPAHDKQDFERSSLFIKLEMRLKQMVNEYWKGHCQLVGYQPVAGGPLNVVNKSFGQPQVLDVDTQQLLPTSRSAVVGLAANPQSGESVKEGTSVVSLNFPSIDQLCDENIQLFRRCEEYRQEEVELERTIEELEKELEETRKKCTQLSKTLENRKKQTLINPHIERV